MKRLLNVFLAIALLVSLSACERMGDAEQAVVFNTLPIIGGVREKVVQKGEMEMKLPWYRFYKIDTGTKSISWGEKGTGDFKNKRDYILTRTLDGNEVGLAMTVTFRVDETKLTHVVQRVSSTNEGIRRIVTALARADIRTHMNALKTKDFLSQKELEILEEQDAISSGINRRQKAVEKVKEALRTRLGPEGIVIEGVKYDGRRFERRLPDGTVDDEYQRQIEEKQAVEQQTQRELARIRVVEQEKRREYNEAKAKFNRVIEEAEGYKRQAELRGNAYYQAKDNEAEQIRRMGMAEVEGLKKQIEALSGPGGKALLRLSLVKAILDKNPNFVLLNSREGSSTGLDFSRIDMNDLIKQAGVFSSNNESNKSSSSQNQLQQDAEILGVSSFKDTLGEAQIELESPPPVEDPLSKVP